LLVAVAAIFSVADPLIQCSSLEILAVTDADPAPDPALFVSDLQDANNNKKISH
jgi:hypothetical protein